MQLYYIVFKYTCICIYKFVCMLNTLILDIFWVKKIFEFMLQTRVDEQKFEDENHFHVFYFLFI